jgi:hypothetical protein
VVVSSEANRHIQPVNEIAESGRFRTTVYLTESDLTSLDELKIYFRRQEKRQVDRSQIIREAIRHYHQILLTR